MRLLDLFRDSFETRDIDASLFNLGLEDKQKQVLDKLLIHLQRSRVQQFMRVFH